MASSDSEDLDTLLNPMNGLRKNSSRQSQRCDLSTASTTFHSTTFNKRNSKLSLSQRKKFFSQSTPKQGNQLEESYTLDQSDSINVRNTSKSSHEECNVEETSYSDVDINGNAPKKSKLQLSPYSSSKTTFKVEALQMSASPKAESEFSAVIDLVSTDSSSQNTVPLVIPNSPEHTLHPKENIPPFSTPARNAHEDIFPIPPPTFSPVTFLSLPGSNHSSFTKNDLVQQWLESTDVQTNVFEDKSEEEEKIPPSLVIGAESLSTELTPKDLIEEVTSVSISKQKSIKAPNLPQTSFSQKATPMTPKRKRGPPTPRSSDGKLTPQITSYFSPLKATPAKIPIRELSFSNHGIGESSTDEAVDSTENKNQASTSSAKEQWAKLMPRMRGTAENVQREIKQQSTNTTKEAENGSRKCPFYKLIPETGFAIDAFDYGPIKGVTSYFLTHFHYDHYRGLSRKWKQPLYCSQVTANLVRKQFKLSPNLIRVLPMKEPRLIGKVEVVLIDANHCPGSVMFLFRWPTGRCALHVGDFRADPEMELLPELNFRPIDTIYLDTTYCDKDYNFPPQKEVIAYVGRLVRKYADLYPNLLVVCGSYTIGKEKVFMAAAQELDCQVWAPTEKRSILNCIQDPLITERLVTDPRLARVHVVNMADVKPGNLKKYLQTLGSSFSHVLALNPTGWEFDQRTAVKGLDAIQPKIHGNVFIHGIPYSEHSGFSEMRRFIRYFRPRQIIPTVGVGLAAQRKKMEDTFKEWLSNRNV